MSYQKKAILLILILFIGLNTNGQRIKYREYKHQYSAQDYLAKIETPRYSPVAAGVLNYLLPPSAYFMLGIIARFGCIECSYA